MLDPPRFEDELNPLDGSSDDQGTTEQAIVQSVNSRHRYKASVSLYQGKPTVPVAGGKHHVLHYHFAILVGITPAQETGIWRLGDQEHLEVSVATKPRLLELCHVLINIP